VVAGRARALDRRETFKVPPARVGVFSERITFYPKGIEVKGSGTTVYAWFVWDKVPQRVRAEVVQTQLQGSLRLVAHVFQRWRSREY
jgi:hypothetical protein